LRLWQRIKPDEKQPEQPSDMTMTEYEYDSMMRFLDQLIHTRTVAKDLTAERRIKQALERQPFASYFLVQRAMTLELALEVARQKIRELEGAPAMAAPAHELSNFLGGGESTWGVDDQTAHVRLAQQSQEANTVAMPTHLTLEDKCLRFIGNNTAAIWIGLAVTGLLVAFFKP
jgi:hypothetical protein